MVNNNDTITIPRTLVAQALEALREAQVLMERFQDEKLRRSAMQALREALEQPQDKHETVGKAGPMPGADGFTMACFRASDVSVGTELYTRPQHGKSSRVH